jgi:hypothetical protein
MKSILLSAFALITFVSFSQKEALTWHNDLQKAVSISQKEKKPMIVFSFQLLSSLKMEAKPINLSFM